jgi:hypothetical protein
VTDDEREAALRAQVRVYDPDQPFVCHGRDLAFLLARLDAERVRVAVLEGALIKGAARVARLAHDPELSDDVSQALTRQAGELRAAVKARRLLGEG